MEMDSAFVRNWIENWNQRNLESILACFATDVEFTSPKALQFAGSATLRGKDALRAYWTSALQRIHDLHFVLDHWVWDSNRRELLILYIARLNGVRTRACEILRFRTDGLIDSGEGMYGAPVEE